MAGCYDDNPAVERSPSQDDQAMLRREADKLLALAHSLGYKMTAVGFADGRTEVSLWAIRKRD